MESKSEFKSCHGEGAAKSEVPDRQSSAVRIGDLASAEVFPVKLEIWIGRADQLVLLLHLL